MSNPCKARLRKELKKLKQDKEASKLFEAMPLPKDIRTWHYVIKGPPTSAFEGGYYHGVLKFPSEYPFKAPSIMMFTPNGRFKINTKLCLSNSDFHPETWTPYWSVANILIGFVSFMTEESVGIGSIKTMAHQKKLFAQQSLEFNLKNPQFRQLFPRYQSIFNAKQESKQLHLQQLRQTIVDAATNNIQLLSDNNANANGNTNNNNNINTNNSNNNNLRLLQPLPTTTQRDNQRMGIPNAAINSVEHQNKDWLWDYLLIALIIMLIGYGIKMIL